MALRSGTRSGRAVRWSRRGGIVALVLCVAVALSSCTGSGFMYVKSDDFHTYFKVPDKWRLYNTGEILAPRISGLSRDEFTQAKASNWLAGFDASPRPKPAMEHLLSATKYPAGLSLVQLLQPEDADSVSLQTLRNLFFPVDSIASGNNGSAGSGTSGSSSGSGSSSTGSTQPTQSVDVLVYEAANFEGGFHGSHLVAKITSGSDSTTFNQIAVLDQNTSKIYAIVVSCTTRCYEKNQGKIEQIVSSWTVKDS